MMDQTKRKSPSSRWDRLLVLFFRGLRNSLQIQLLCFFRVGGCFFIILLTLLNQRVFSAQELLKDTVRHLSYHEKLGEYKHLLRESAQSLQVHGDIPELLMMHIRALARLEKDQEALSFWSQYKGRFNEQGQHKLLEEIAWSILRKAQRSNSLNNRYFSLIGAAMTESVEAVDIICNNIYASNAMFRYTAAELSRFYKDQPLVDALSQQLEVETVWWVKKQILLSMAKMRLKEKKTLLESYLADSSLSFQEKKEVLEALVSCFDEVSTEKLHSLYAKKRSIWRQLACDIIASLNLIDQRHLLEDLLLDPQEQVRIAAIRALALLPEGVNGSDDLIKKVEPLLNDSSRDVCIQSAWFMTLKGSPKGLKAFDQLMMRSIKEDRRCAAVALKATGVYGKRKVFEYLEKEDDPYVRLYLALACISFRENLEKAAYILEEFLTKEKKLISKKLQGGTFYHFAPLDNLRPKQQDSNPHVEDQIIRLELTSILALINREKAQEILKQKLKDKRWEVSRFALATLLEKGGELSYDLIKSLTKDEDKKISLQACLLLASFFQDQSVLDVLQEKYFDSNYENKIKILEAIGQIASKHSFDFLVGRLEEPFETLRIVAASSLILCLRNQRT